VADDSQTVAADFTC